MLPGDVQDVRFRKARIGRRGYDEDEVDEFLDRIEDALRGKPGMTIDGLRGTVIGRSPIGRRGYRDEDVDAFVQRVIAEWPTDNSTAVPPGPPAAALEAPARDTTESRLAGLAQDVLEHEACPECRSKAADAIEHLGLLDEVLTRIGKDDPRTPLP
jgi:DivIVA domain-containing protein